MRKPAFDQDGYPNEDTLEKIREWSPGDWPGFWRVVTAAWDNIYGATSYIPVSDDGDFHLKLVTGGWSGNEDIISAIDSNPTANALFWLSSHRGGKHLFSLPVGVVETEVAE